MEPHTSRIPLMANGRSGPAWVPLRASRCAGQRFLLHIFPSVRSANCVKTWHRKEIRPARSSPLERAHARKTQTPQRVSDGMCSTMLTGSTFSQAEAQQDLHAPSPRSPPCPAHRRRVTTRSDRSRRNVQGKMVGRRAPSHRRGNNAAVAGAGCSEGGSVSRACARGCASAASEVVGTPWCDEHDAARGGHALWSKPSPRGAVVASLDRRSLTS
jgi:hypothetical protein